MKRHYRNIQPYSVRMNLKRLLDDPRLNSTPYDSSGDESGLGWVHSPQSSLVSSRTGDINTRRMKEALDAGSPQDESKAYKRARDKRITELSEHLRKDTVPRELFHKKREDATEYHKVVKGLVVQGQDRTRRQQEDELKSLLRERDPDNRDAGKLTFLREAERTQI